MRYATVTLSWDGEQSHPLEDIIAETPDLDFVASHSAKITGDGMFIDLLQFRGDPELFEEVLENEPSVVDYEFSKAEEMVYLRTNPPPRFNNILQGVFEQDVVIRWPIRISAPKTIHITFIGSETALNKALQNFPAGVDVSLESTGEYSAGLSDPILALTDQQRTLLETALKSGYYEVPRETTQKELADEFGVTAGTISDRLHRIEARILKSLTKDRFN